MAGGFSFVATVPVTSWYQPNIDVGGAIQNETLYISFMLIAKVYIRYQIVSILLPSLFGYLKLSLESDFL
jgi:hypothetical protein